MLHIVLYKPEKPLNVGNIMRTCVAIGAKLHVIGPLTFTLNDKSIKRSGLDYRDQLKWQYYQDYREFNNHNNNPEIYCLTRYGNKNYTEALFNDQTNSFYVMFGSESSGIDKEILNDHQSRKLRIPMKADVRSLNLANSVAIVVYEIMRQQQFKGLSLTEKIKKVKIN